MKTPSINPESHLILKAVFPDFSDRRLRQAEETLFAAGITLSPERAVPKGRTGIPVTFPALSSAFPELKMNALMKAWVTLHQDMKVVMAVRPLDAIRRDVVVPPALGRGSC